MLCIGSHRRLPLDLAPTAVLSRRNTGAMAQADGRRRDLTPMRHALNIAAATTKAAEKARLIRRAHGLRIDTAGVGPEAGHIVAHELSAERWRDDGMTRAARAGGSS